MGAFAVYNDQVSIDMSCNIAAFFPKRFFVSLAT